jgi:hypothetical protein
MQLYTTDNISTNIVLHLKSRQITEKSDRTCLHSKIVDGKLKVFVPRDSIQRETCYRSQLPNLFREILGIQSRASTFPISLILGSNLQMVDDLMREQDISPVPWITKPPIEITCPQNEQSNSSSGMISTLSSRVKSTRAFSLLTPSRTTSSSKRLSATSINNYDLSPPGWHIDSGIGTPEPKNLYRDLLDQIIAQVNGPIHEDGDGASNLSNLGDALEPSGETPQIFDRATTFSDRKIGAAGELYVGSTTSGNRL